MENIMALSNEAIFDELKKILVESFETPEAQITLEANLYEDLDLDSIDAVDLAVKLQTLTGKRIKADEFKAVRTVADVVRAVRSLLDS
ncbi:MAG: acyl carrier protein [Denitromonas halophila]|uniref:Acyl carrier protein n=3 Tax=Denitromonas TaxID=139331 RepID=A0A558EIT9_9RHOO|nr:acyl carrier protein [Denitromonas ohlonensis]TVO76221.1 acyl carrier protein [Denitromonas ohlonensis]TVT46872.1 MAG: acyl carrier protein [Denitromonas halophila]TVT73311.1 MAG: acyl carrier protein [Denitromonas halophila]TVT77608.1 MAG: acyl carrier protein [Denitromonas halophila]